jgi:hypothetical protein
MLSGIREPLGSIGYFTSVLLPGLKRKIAPKGEITMRKDFAINFVTYDGDMQSPGALQ